MPTSKEFIADFDLKTSGIPYISYRAMMGEYVLYYRGKVVGGFYDNRLLVKPVEGLEVLLPTATLQIPYTGAKPMVWIEKLDGGLLKDIFEFLYQRLPEKKKKEKK